MEAAGRQLQHLTASLGTKVALVISYYDAYGFYFEDQ